MAAKDDKLEIALAHFQSGKSPRECEALTGVSRGKITRATKERGLVKGSVSHLITDGAKVKAEIEPLNEPLKSLILAEIDNRSHSIRERNLSTDLLFKKIKESIPVCEVTEIKSLADALDRVCITSEIAPRFSNVIAINNTNAQQNAQPIVATRVIDNGR